MEPGTLFLLLSVLEQYKSLWPKQAILTNLLFCKMVSLSAHYLHRLSWLHTILSCLLENFLTALLEYLS